MFDWVLNTPLFPVKNKETNCYMKNLKLYDPFLSMGFNCLKASEPLQGGSLLFTTQGPGVPGTHLINLGRMKEWVELGTAQRF